MKSSTKKVLVFLGVQYVVIFFIGVLVGRGCSRNGASGGDEPDPEVIESIAESDPVPDPEVPDQEEPARREVIYYCPKISYSKAFADLNDAHIEAAKKCGLQTIPHSRDGVGQCPGLVRISDNDFYVLETLKYSVPFLTKRAAAELDAISRAFDDSLKRKGLLDYRLVVSSVLRTEEDVTRLRRSGNPNASENSAHCYGTTFDITYTKYDRPEETLEFMQPYELTKVLAEVLRDRKSAGHILVKYERKEHCFHITSK